MHFTLRMSFPDYIIYIPTSRILWSEEGFKPTVISLCVCFTLTPFNKALNILFFFKLQLAIFLPSLPSLQYFLTCSKTHVTLSDGQCFPVYSLGSTGVSSLNFLR